MRIGMMVDLYKPHVSGITNYISLNKQYLESAGHEVYIFTFGDLADQPEEANVILSPGLQLPDTKYYLSFNYTRKAKKILQTMDLVHVHHPFLSGRLALRYCRPLRIPIIFTNHTRYDLYAQTYLPLLPEELSTTFLQTYMPPFCSAVDLVISPSAGMAEILKDLGVTSPIKIIPNGVDIQRYREQCQDCRPEHGFSPENILLVYSGRLAPEKNLDFLLQAFIGVAEAVPNAHLLLIGGGPEEEKLRLAVSKTSVTDRVHFTGMVPYEELPRLLAMCDAFVTASVSEVHPLSVIEAMASGLPALGIHSVGVGDIITHGETGLLARLDQAALAAIMVRICIDAPLRKQMGAEARRSSEEFSIERTSLVMIETYENLIFAYTGLHRGLRYRLQYLLEKWIK